MFSLPFIQRRLFPVSLGIKGDRYSLKFECELHNFKSCHNTNYMELDNNEKTERKKGIKDIFIGLVFFFLTFIMSCFNMLLLMTFNGWLIFSIVIGACLGYLGGEITNMIRKSTA